MEIEASNDAVVGKINIRDLVDIFPGELSVKRRKPNKRTSTVPKHDLYIVVGKTAVLMNTDEQQAFLQKKLFGKAAPVADKKPESPKPAPGTKPDNVPAKEAPPAKPPVKSWMEDL